MSSTEHPAARLAGAQDPGKAGWSRCPPGRSLGSPRCQGRAATAPEQGPASAARRVRPHHRTRTDQAVHGGPGRDLLLCPGRPSGSGGRQRDAEDGAGPPLPAGRSPPARSRATVAELQRDQAVDRALAIDQRFPGRAAGCPVHRRIRPHTIRRPTRCPTPAPARAAPAASGTLAEPSGSARQAARSPPRHAWLARAGSTSPR